MIRTDRTLKPRRAFAILRLREPWLVHIRAATRAAERKKTAQDAGEAAAHILVGTRGVPKSRIRDAAPEEQLIGTIIVGGVRKPRAQ